MYDMTLCDMTYVTYLLTSRDLDLRSTFDIEL